MRNPTLAAALGVLLFVRMNLSAADRPVYQTLRYNEDWSVLRDASARSDWLDPVKFVPFAGTNAWLSLGGEARLKHELYDRPALNQKPADEDGFLLQRYLLHSDVHVGPHFRVFGQLQSSLEDFRDGGPRPTDRDDLDLHQAFFDVVLSGTLTDELTLRIGRQEMAYGSQRLVSVRESPNNRLAYDSVRVLSKFNEWTADAWVSQPVEIDPRVFDDHRLDNTAFWGAYASGPVRIFSGLRADFYYLGLSRDQAKFARGSGDELRHSLGTRLWGRRGALDWNFELVGQFGSFGDKGILAWTAASDTGWTLTNVPASPRLFLRADIASGDHGGSDLGTFNPLFPRGAYFNEAALVGPQNLMDLQPGVELSLARSLKFAASCDLVWRESLEDGVYGVALNLQVPPGKSEQRHVGTFPAATLTWQADGHFSVSFNYVSCLFGGFVAESVPTQRDVNYLSVVAVYKF